jgi:4-hydroxybenzoate polyprenyltransferase
MQPQAGRENPTPMQATKVRQVPAALYHLTRAKEHIPFVVPVTVLGSLLAAHSQGILIDWRLAWVTAANVLAVTFAFMINDIEDWQDDARSPERAQRNPVSRGDLPPWLGYLACLAVAVAAVVLYSLAGPHVLIIGLSTVLLSHLYSWQVLRLKAWPLVDVLSHSLMLGGLLFLGGFFAFSAEPGWVWAVAVGITLMSAYGQIYNQLRDLADDEAAGLRNTSVLLGPRRARWLMYAILTAAALALTLAAWQRLFPWQLALVAIAATLVSLRLSKLNDMRGTPANDVSGRYQSHGLLVTNLTVGSWLVWTLLSQLGSLGSLTALVGF